MKFTPKAFLFLSGGLFVLTLVTGIAGAYEIMGLAAVVMCILLAVFFQTHARLATFTFTFWVLAFFLASLVYPAAFLEVQGFDQRKLIVPLIQIIMFGMGATLSLKDFGAALKQPRAVSLGIVLQFSVMPIVGWILATMVGFEPEIAAGIILIGSCPGGVASNVMAYLSKGNVALSVTMTACSTMLAPFVTPFAMKILAGRLIEINVMSMMLSIVNLIILPIAAGLVTHYLLNSRLSWKAWRPVTLVLGIVFLVVARSAEGGVQQLNSIAAALILMTFLRRSWLAKGLPLISMAGICYIVAIIAANSRQEIMTVGIALFGVALVHNLLGYLFGYWGARAIRLKESDCRTIALEVGLQNGGMGAALALDVLKSNNAALGPVVFGTWMNLTGSTLASWWRGRLPADETPPKPVAVKLPV